MRRTDAFTFAAILKGLSRMVLTCALASSVTGNAIHRKACTRRYVRRPDTLILSIGRPDWRLVVLGPPLFPLVCEDSPETTLNC